VSDASLRDAYLAWTRRAVPVAALPLALTAALQAASASSWWADSPPSAGSVRYLFMAVGVASVMMGRSARLREAASAPLTVPTLISLSWRLVVFALAPSVVGAVLAFMTRDTSDFYVMLLVTLVGYALLYPRFVQWVAWSEPGAAKDAE